MKALEYLILTLFLLFVVMQNAAAAQTEPYLYVVVQHGENSAVYNENIDKFHNEVVAKFSDKPGVVFIDYNVTADHMNAATKSDLDWFTIYSASFENNTEEGIILIDASNKSVIERLNMDATTKAILKSIAHGSQMIARSK
jgi:hypothetical protein